MKINYLQLIKMLSRFTFYGLFLQVFFFTFILANSSDAQRSVRDVSIEVSGTYNSLEEIFKTIEKQTDFEFAYAAFMNDVNQDIKIAEGNRRVGDVLLEISRMYKLKFRQVNNSISVNKVKSNQMPEQGLLEVLQTRTISGKVTSQEDQTGLPGVNVIVKGTVQGTVTDVNGNYSLDVPTTETTLVFSSVGFIQEEVNIGNQSVIDMVMTPDITALEEIVVIGYGTVKKSDLTGSVGSISAKDIEHLPVSSVNETLMGKAAGVQVTSQSGRPGVGMSVRIRGSNSIQGNNEPLYVVDGMPFDATPSGGNFSQNPLSTLNPTDIQSIEILKDASAVAIYGSRGANGVVIITTKQGEIGAPVVSFDAYYGIQSSLRPYETIGASQFMQYYNDYATYEDNPLLDPFTSDEISSPETDIKWYDEVVAPAPQQNYLLSVSGGSASTKYFFSGGYFNQEGIITGSGYDRFNIRANLDMNPSEKLTIGVNINLSYQIFEGNYGNNTSGGWGGGIVYALQTPNIVPIYDDANPDGYNRNSPTTNNPFHNPVEEAKEQIRIENNLRLMARTFADYELLPGLNYRINLATDLGTNHLKGYLPLSSLAGQYQGRADRNASLNRYWLIENTLNYAKIIGDHSINVLAGYTAEESQWEALGTQGRNFPDDALIYNNFFSLSPENVSGFSNEGRWALESYLGRIMYSFKDKYLLTLSGRFDGSSKFPENKYGFFPSGAFAWKVIDEAFMENISTISNLKLRVSYGQTGSQAINAYNALSQAGGPAGWKLTSVDGRNPTTALYQTAMGNQDLKWETTTQTDIGIDLGLFENRLNITADYYYKKTSDLLFNKRYPNIADNDNQIIENVGSMENEGIDLNISAVISDRNGFRWDAMVNFSWVRNEILDLGTDANGAEVPFLVLSPVNERAGVKDENSFWRITQVGKPLGAFYVPIFDGIVSTEEQRANHPYFVSDAGSAVYKDVNGDGRINQNDRVIYGQAAPDFVGGITNNFSYKGIDLNIFFDYSIGNKVMNMTNYVLTRGGGQYNITKEYYDSYWREDVNTASAKYPRADRSILLSSHYVEDGSFLRLRNVTLGYTLPESVLESLNIRKLRLYATASNLLMITKYSGMSPDVNVDITNNLGQGLDYSAYPASRLVMLGINITL